MITREPDIIHNRSTPRRSGVRRIALRGNWPGGGSLAFFLGLIVARLDILLQHLLGVLFGWFPLWLGWPIPSTCRVLGDHESRGLLGRAGGLHLARLGKGGTVEGVALRLEGIEHPANKMRVRAAAWSAERQIPT